MERAGVPVPRVLAPDGVGGRALDLAQELVQRVEPDRGPLQSVADRGERSLQPAGRDVAELARERAEVGSDVDEQGVPGRAVGGPVQEHLRERAGSEAAKGLEPRATPSPSPGSDEDRDRGGGHGEGLVRHHDGQPEEHAAPQPAPRALGIRKGHEPEGHQQRGHHVRQRADRVLEEDRVDGHGPAGEQARGLPGDRAREARRGQDHADPDPHLEEPHEPEQRPLVLDSEQVRQEQRRGEQEGEERGADGLAVEDLVPAHQRLGVLDELHGVGHLVALEDAPRDSLESERHRDQQRDAPAARSFARCPVVPTDHATRSAPCGGATAEPLRPRRTSHDSTAADRRSEQVC